jgi:hypothetical protein
VTGLKALTLAGSTSGCLLEGTGFTYELRTEGWTDTSHRFILNETVHVGMRVFHIFLGVCVNKTMIMRSGPNRKCDGAVFGA